jgi:NADPH:quinone reductase-like Zn-dependent oxidoreductase
MKAAVYSRYGPPEVLQIKDIAKPVPNDSEVLIMVHAASVNPLDEGLMKGAGRIVTGLLTPKDTQPGVDLAGRVEAVGRNVTQFQPGDEVFGVCISYPQASGFNAWVHHQGAFAEYVCAHESTLVLKPDNVTFEQAASVPVAAFTALQGLRDKGEIQAGQRVLINGAAGGVGTLAVQVAKSFGAEVTGVCSARNVEMVRFLGADHVVDYAREDFTKRGQRYDLIFDCVGNHPLSACRRALNPEGILIMVGEMCGRGMLRILGRLIAAFVLSRLASQRLVTFLAKPNQEDLIVMHNLLKAGLVRPIIDRRYSLSELPAAFRYLAGKHAQGKVVITLA